VTLIIGILIGIVIGGAACAISAKTLGWFNKQVGSVEKKV
jgi:gas vesicle protein